MVFKENLHKVYFLFNQQNIRQLIIVAQIKLKVILPHTPHKFKLYTSNDFRKIVYNKDTRLWVGLSNSCMRAYIYTNLNSYMFTRWLLSFCYYYHLVLLISLRSRYHLGDINIIEVVSVGINTSHFW